MKSPVIVFLLKIILLSVVIIGIYTPGLIEEYHFLQQFLTAAYTFLSTSVLISIFRFVILFIYSKRKNLRNNTVSNFVLGINQVATILNVTFFIIAIFVLLGIDVKEFLTSITLVAMAIALIFREYITNMISGLIIMFSDKYEVTDYIKIGEYSGRIENMSLQNVQIRNEDGDTVLIPNNAFFTSNIVNKSIDNKGSFVMDFQIPILYSTKEILIEKFTEEFFSQQKDIPNLKSYKLSISKLTYEYIQFKLNLEYEYVADLNFPKIKSDYLKFLLNKVSQDPCIKS